MEEALQKIIPIVLFLGVIALLTGAMAIVNSGFGETMTQCYNSSFALSAAGGACVNSSDLVAPAGCCGKDALNLSNEYFAVVSGQDALNTVGQQQPTIAIISVMVIIILMLVGIFGYIGLKRL